ncbi:MULTISPECIES: hypothetical protein [unclassified Nocardia]|uniref:hypothetical protein n=1 Tax=unclassified Nocardia TaxID=2637762 RepID=UPI001CE4607C|nr:MULTISPECIES: hypothetical protein [unclassified Nocardia]
MNHVVGQWLRQLADRLDHDGAPKSLGWTFTIEPAGPTLHLDGRRGCPLLIPDNASYGRAHRDALRGSGRAATLSSGTGSVRRSTTHRNRYGGPHPS